MNKSSLLVRLALVVNAGIFLSMACLWLSNSWHGEMWRADFSGYYTGWRMVLDGEGRRLYDLELQAAYQRRLVPPLAETPQNQLPFNYPPHLAVVAVLGLLPRSAAYYAWFLLQLGMLACLLRLLLRLGRVPVGETRVLWIVTVLAFPPTMVTLNHGQVSLLVLLCQTGLVQALLAGKRWRAAAWFVLGTVKPPLMLVPGVILLAAGRWGVLWRAGVLFAPWAALTLVALGQRCWLDFFQVIRHSAAQAGVYGIYPERMTNFKALLLAWLGLEQLQLANAVGAAAVLLACVLVVVLWRGRWASGRELLLRLSLCLQLGILFNPHQYMHDTVALVLPGVLLWMGVEEKQSWRPWVGAALLSAPTLFLIGNECRLGLMIALAVATAGALASLVFASAASGRRSPVAAAA